MLKLQSILQDLQANQMNLIIDARLVAGVAADRMTGVTSQTRGRAD